MQRRMQRIGLFLALASAACLVYGCSGGDAPRAEQTTPVMRGHDASASESELEPAALDASVPDAEMPRRDAGAAESDRDANGGDSDPTATPSVSGGCPVHVSVVTSSYGTGNNDDDDYAPNNVGAIWVTDPQGGFVRTLAVWGPGYWTFAETWVKQSGGSRVDIVAGATRKNHRQPVEADWDCRDKTGTRVAGGPYRLNVEFSEAEEQGPLLSGNSSLPFTLGDDAVGVLREPSGSFGPIVVRVAPP
jgi:hypothetical protein